MPRRDGKIISFNLYILNSVFQDDPLENILLYAPSSPGKQSKTTVSTLATRAILIPSSKRLFLLANKIAARFGPIKLTDVYVCMRADSRKISVVYCNGFIILIQIFCLLYFNSSYK